jgi:cysteine desulfurase
MSEQELIYLDHAATTPVAAEVCAAMLAVLADPALAGNPASAGHAPGRRAAAVVEQARAEVAAVIGATAEDIVFTSGATESDNLAILGMARGSAWRGRHVVSARTEHRAVLDALERLEREGFVVTLLDPGPCARIEPAQLGAALREDTILVSLMHVNNETGALNEIGALGRVCREAGVPLHVDAAQSVGKLPVDVGGQQVDLLSLNAHKAHGPKGVGALYVAAAARRRLEPLLFGGGQEGGLRPGTLATHQIVGLARSLQLAEREREREYARLQSLKEAFWEALRPIGGVLANSPLDDQGSPWILNVCFEGVEGESLRYALEGLAVSSGSACNSASHEGSYVLRSLGRSDQQAGSSLRFSFGRATTAEQLARAAAQVLLAVRRLRAIAPGAAGVQPTTGVR